MKKHLVYFTFGEQQGSVYATQVKQLLNYWARRGSWKVTLVQIADEENFLDLDEQVERVFIKRKFKLLFKYHLNSYAKEITSALNLEKTNSIYFNSRGDSAHSIASFLNKKLNLNVAYNNLDIRGTIEEFKLSKTRRFLYPYFKYRSRKNPSRFNMATTVTYNLRRHIIEDYKLDEKEVKIKVVPTLSMLDYKPKEIKSNITFIGKIAWIDPDSFVKQTLKINEIAQKFNWSINFIGNTSGTFGLEKYGVNFIDRMTPEELAEFVTSFHTGMVLRDDSIVNKVAAPCKISDYLCLGMPIIYSGEIGSLKDFKDKFPECTNFLIHVDELSDESFENLQSMKEDNFKELAAKAQSYFGIQAVIDRYMKIFGVE